jgi:hypothetical protein
LGDDAQFGPSHGTLRPPGAVPPPPRPLPHVLKQEAPLTRAPTPLATPIPSVYVNADRSGASASKAAASSNQTLASAAEAKAVPPFAEPVPVRPHTLSGLGDDGSGIHTAGVTPNSTFAEVRARPTRARLALIALSIACVALLIALTLALRALSSQPAPRVTAASASASAAPASSTGAGCALTVHPARVAASVERAVEPYFLDVTSERVAVGFAASRSQAAGMIVDLTNLDQTPAFEEAGEQAVLSVVPTQVEPLRFAADRDHGQVGSPHSLDSTPRAVLGFTSAGVVIRMGSDAPTLLWPTPDVPKTQPRVARVGDNRRAVLFRQGGLSGVLLVGWLDEALRPLGDLNDVGGAPQLVGTPALAAGKLTALAAFAGRDNEREPWRVRLASLAPEQPARVTTEFSHSAEGAGNGAIAPTLSALGSDQWILQWTQGKSGEYRVFVQALAADLSPLGAPVPSSPKGASAGQGSLWVVNERALSLYVLTVGGRDELWGSVLTCR